MLTLPDVFSESNISHAFEHLLRAKDSSGVDGLRLSELQEYWDLNKEALIDEISTGVYVPGIIKEVEILQPNNKKRRITNICSVDRLILRALVQLLENEFDCRFSQSSFAFRKNKGLREAVKCVVNYANSGMCWTGEVDIKNFFDNIPIGILEKKLELWIEDVDLLRLIKLYLRPRVQIDFSIVSKQKGILLGSAISPILSEIYLSDFDKMLEAKGYNFLRYCDNINAYFNTYEEALEYVASLKEILEKTFCLEINNDKSGVFSILDRKYLGYTLTKSAENGRIYAHKERKRNNRTYNYWAVTNIQKIDRNYHLINDGILTKKDYTILFENPGKKQYLPVETVDSITIYSNVTLSAEFLRFAGAKKLLVNIVDRYGNLAGRYVGGGFHSNSKLFIKQVAAYEDIGERLKIAKKILKASIHNMRANVRYYGLRKKSELLKEKEQKITAAIKEMDNADAVESLMMIEARIRQMYYGAFAEIISDSDFELKKRTKRPPRDPVNALISFGNTVLYNRIAVEIYKSGLDVRIAYLHSTNSRKQSLNLDIAEIYNPIIVDRVIFTIINKGMIDSKAHFEKVENGGIYMTAEGKRIFINELEHKLCQKIKVGEQSISYNTLMRREVKHFKKFMDTGEKWKPYKYY